MTLSIEKNLSVWFLKLSFLFLILSDFTQQIYIYLHLLYIVLSYMKTNTVGEDMIYSQMYKENSVFVHAKVWS